MQFGDALVNMISEFTAMNRSPDHRWRPTAESRIAPVDEHLLASSSSSSSAVAASTHFGHNRRHSLQLTVGVSGDVAPINVQRRPLSSRCLSVTSRTTKSQPHLSWWKSKSKERRQSEPVIEPGESLHKRLEYLKRKTKQSFSRKDEENKVDESCTETLKTNTSPAELPRCEDSTLSETTAGRRITRTDRGSIIVLDEAGSSDTDDETTRL